MVTFFAFGENATIDQVEELLAGIDRSTLSGKRDFGLVNLLVRTGLRTLEVARANAGDIRQQGGEALRLVVAKIIWGSDHNISLTKRTC